MASTLKCDTIQNASSATANLTLDASGNATVGGTLAMGSSFKRNRVINGDMRVDQRNAGAAVTINAASRTYGVDRFLGFGQSADGVFTIQQNTSAPAGFINSTKVTVTTADASVGASQYYLFGQSIEGTNISDLSWGSASASTVTLSFWVRSSLTGTFGGSLQNQNADRSYPFTYTISSVDTWEKKAITIIGDTTGTWFTTTAIGMNVWFDLGCGSSNIGTSGSWAAAGYYGATGGTKLISTLNATWYVTGVQLEVGSVATPYERQIYSDQLAQCQRYLPAFSGLYGGFIGQCYSTVGAYPYIIFPVTTRTAPTGISVNSAGNYILTQASTAQSTCGSVTFGGGSTQSAFINASVASGTPLVAGNASMFWGNASSLLYFTGCEL